MILFIFHMGYSFNRLRSSSKDWLRPFWCGNRRERRQIFSAFDIYMWSVLLVIYLFHALYYGMCLIKWFGQKNCIQYVLLMTNEPTWKFCMMQYLRPTKALLWMFHTVCVIIGCTVHCLQSNGKFGRDWVPSHLRKNCLIIYCNVCAYDFTFVHFFISNETFPHGFCTPTPPNLLGKLHWYFYQCKPCRL